MPQQNLTVRPAVQTDFAAVTAMRHLLARQSHLERPQEFRPAPLDGLTEAQFAQWLAAPDVRRLVAVRSDDVPIGFASVWVGWTFASDWMFANHDAFIMELCVDPRHRRLGAGRALLEAIEAAATTEGAESVVLQVNVSNQSARDFYQGLGYMAAGETRIKRLRTIVRVENP